MNIIYIFALLAVIILGYVISQYNWFQTTLVRITASIQEIGNQLKRQASLIPNLENSAKGYLKHEKGIYKSITDARKAVDDAAESNDATKIDKVSNSLQSLIPKLQVLVESNPEMKAEKVITQLMAELRDTSDKLLYSRRLVIDLSADFNQRLAVIPSNFVGKMLGFKPQKGLSTPTEGAHLEVDEAETVDPKVSL
jgi:LemA protein